MTAYYNEHDAYAAQWLRNLIKAGHIAPGVVDERSIEDVTPDELRQYTQCHFFAGIGVWSLALRRAGWDDSRPVWTGSAPCQPFSAAGAGTGFADERHLWPSFAWLIAQCAPPVVFGEQVASKAVEPWVDLVHADLEALGYAFGAVPFPSAGVGAPHIRDRLYWVADSADQRQHGRWPSSQGDGRDAARIEPERLCDVGGMGNSNGQPTWRGTGAAHATQVEHGSLSGDGNGPRHASGSLLNRMADSTGGQRDGFPELRRGECNREDAGWPESFSELESCRATSGMAHPFGGGRLETGCHPSGYREKRARQAGNRPGDGSPEDFIARMDDTPPAGPVNGFWRDADWLSCRDEKWRPVRSGSFPLAHGAAGRMVCVCPDCKTETVIYEGVHSLRNVPERDQRLGTEEILRQGMLQAASFVATAHEQKHGALQSPGCGKEQVLQSLRGGEEIGSAPPRPKRTERQPEQPGEDLLGLSRPGAPESFADIDMRGVWGELHRSLASEPKQDMFCPLCKRVGSQECVEEVGGSRVGRLRAYGNAINAEAATQFIASYLEIPHVIYATPYNPATLRCTGPSTDSGFSSLDEVPMLLGEPATTHRHMVTYPESGVAYTDFPLNIDTPVTEPVNSVHTPTGVT